LGRKASRTVYILAGLLVVGAILRFAGIGVKSFWVDEGGTADRTGLPFWLMLADVKAHDTHPPFYYILLFWWQRVFGAGDGEGEVGELGRVSNFGDGVRLHILLPGFPTACAWGCTDRDVELECGRREGAGAEAGA